MHEYDIVLKSLVTGSPNSLFHLITGAKRGRWLNVELPKVMQARVDLLFELALTRELILLELQSHNTCPCVWPNTPSSSGGSTNASQDVRLLCG